MFVNIIDWVVGIHHLINRLCSNGHYFNMSNDR